MLNKIIKQLEDAKEYFGSPMITIDDAIKIIKQHESEFDKHNIMDFLEYVTKGREVGLTIESSLIEAINKYLNQNYKNE